MLRPAINLIVYVALYAAFLFGPAGTLRWRAPWVFLAVFFLSRSISTLLLYRSRRALLVERARLPLQRGQSTTDMVLLPAYMASVAALVAFTAWDSRHGHIMGELTTPVRALGLVLLVAGVAVAHSALRTNPFAVTVVRHQAERGHVVVTAWPYSVVRHPMYVGLVLQDISIPLWLGSIAGVLASIVPAALLMVRIVGEEHLLSRSFPEYSRYIREVRWRLVPGVW